MVKVNPEPDQKGKYTPFDRVTGLYSSTDDLFTILQSLQLAGFGEHEIDLFIGQEGAEKLDLKRKKIGAVVRFFQDLKTLLSDETEIQKQVDEVLRGGGMAINVLTGSDDKKKHSVVNILKAHHPQDVRYWGQLTIERF